MTVRNLQVGICDKPHPAYAGNHYLHVWNEGKNRNCLRLSDGTWVYEVKEQPHHLCAGFGEEWVPFGTHINHQRMPLEFRGEDEAQMPTEERVACPYASQGGRCSPAICDCFISNHPDSPFGLHPEDFVVGGGREENREASPQAETSPSAQIEIHKASDGVGRIVAICGSGGYQLADHWENVTCTECLAVAPLRILDEKRYCYEKNDGSECAEPLHWGTIDHKHDWVRVENGTYLTQKVGFRFCSDCDREEWDNGVIRTGNRDHTRGIEKISRNRKIPHYGTREEDLGVEDIAGRKPQ